MSEKKIEILNIDFAVFYYIETECSKETLQVLYYEWCINTQNESDYDPLKTYKDFLKYLSEITNTKIIRKTNNKPTITVKWED